MVDILLLVICVGSAGLNVWTVFKIEALLDSFIDSLQYLDDEES